MLYKKNDSPIKSEKFNFFLNLKLNFQG